MCRAAIYTSLEDDGVTCGLLRDFFTPNIFTGRGGVAYQLMRLHPESHAPSVMMLGGRAF